MGSIGVRCSWFMGFYFDHRSWESGVKNGDGKKWEWKGKIVAASPMRRRYGRFCANGVKFGDVRMPGRKGLAITVALVAVAASIVALLWRPSPHEPSYGGKKLSAWLDELSAMDHPANWDPGTKPAQAVRAIGTNAIPWLLYELRTEPSGLQWRLNQLLTKQKIVKYRFPDVNV